MNEYDIAIVGIALKFPGANSIEEYWDLIRKGKEAITFFSEEDLKTKGVSPEKIQDEHYIKAAPILDNVSAFDEKFFNYSPSEAIAMDPQHRIWLECCWHAIENAGYAPDKLKGSTGVFGSAGGNISSYFLEYLRANPDIVGETGSIPQLGNDKDFLATRVSYKLNLKGPSMTVQSACSSSLVSVHLACQSLLNGECDMALAGGSTIRVPHLSGYQHEDGGILSSDGHCRAFDEKADGVVFGSGVGAVLLKPALKALEDQDHIYAIIKATAINNDGGQKISYTASSSEGQMRAVREAIELSDINPQEIGYMEAHGTGTKLGDPVEVSALNQAFRKDTEDKQFCAIGSVKSNIGHCEASAGIAGLIKVALCLHHKQIPPLANFETPNRKINFDESVFYVPKTLRNWDSQKSRKAGLNSLGMGGTNAFAILEEAPIFRDLSHKHPRKNYNILTISAKTDEALNDYVDQYLNFLETNKAGSFDSICYTANTGRSHFSRRLAVVANSIDDCINKLMKYSQGHQPKDVYVRATQSSSPNELQNVIQIDSKMCNNKRYLKGLCTSYVHGAEVNWQTSENPPLKRVVLPNYPFQRNKWWVQDPSPYPLNVSGFKTEVLESGLLEVKYYTAVGPLLTTGISIEKFPYLLDHRVNHNIVLPLAAYIEMGLSAAREALGNHPIHLKDILIKKELILKEKEVRQCQIHLHPSTNNTYDLKLFFYDQQDKSDSGVWTMYSSMVLSIAQSEKPNWAECGQSVSSQPTHKIDIANHYKAFDKAGLNFGPSFRHIESLQKRGESIHGDIDASTPDQLSTRGYLLHPVILDNCLQTLGGLFTNEEQENSLYLPLSIDSFNFHRSPKNNPLKVKSIGKIRTSNLKDADLYVADVLIFDTSDSLIAEVNGICFKRVEKSKDIHSLDLTYQIQWKRTDARDELGKPEGLTLIFSDENELAKPLHESIISLGKPVEIITDETRINNSKEKSIDLMDVNNLERLFEDLSEKHKMHISDIIFACSGHYRHVESIVTKLEDSQKHLCGRLLTIAQAILRKGDPTRLSIIVPEIFRVTENQMHLSLLPSSIPGLINVLNHEHPELVCKVIDTDRETPTRQSMKEVYQRDGSLYVAFRDNTRYLAELVQAQTPDHDTVSDFYREGTYIVTGGTGELGEIAVEWLVRQRAKNIILLSRSSSPKKQLPTWTKKWCHEGTIIEQMNADVADYEQTQAVFGKLKESYPPIKGIFHLAGILEDASIARQTWQHFWNVMAPKVQGSYNLHLLSQELDLDFFVLFSSAAGMLGTLGQSNYAAGNSFLDGLMRYRRLNNLPAVSICWGPWEKGMAANISAQDASHLKAQGFNTLQRSQGLYMLNRLVFSQAQTEIGAFSIDWNQYEKHFEGQKIALNLKAYPQKQLKGLTSTNAPTPNLDIHSEGGVKEFLFSEVARILSMDKDDIDEEQPLIEIGLDSLMAVQLRNDLSKQLNKTLPVTMFFDYPSLNQASNFLSKEAT